MSTGGTTNKKPQLVDLQLVGVLFLFKNLLIKNKLEYSSW
jgi:hypothetical protein